MQNLFTQNFRGAMISQKTKIDLNWTHLFIKQIYVDWVPIIHHHTRD